MHTLRTYTRNGKHGILHALSVSSSLSVVYLSSFFTIALNLTLYHSMIICTVEMQFLSMFIHPWIIWGNLMLMSIWIKDTNFDISICIFYYNVSRIVHVDAVSIVIVCQYMHHTSNCDELSLLTFSHFMTTYTNL